MLWAPCVLHCIPKQGSRIGEISPTGSYAKGRKLVIFVVEMRQGKPVVKLDGFTEGAFTQTTDGMAWVIDEAIRRARVHNQARDVERRAG